MRKAMLAIFGVGGLIIVAARSFGLQRSAEESTREGAPGQLFLSEEQYRLLVDKSWVGYPWTPDHGRGFRYEGDFVNLRGLEMGSDESPDAESILLDYWLFGQPRK